MGALPPVAFRRRPPGYLWTDETGRQDAIRNVGFWRSAWR